MMRIHVGNLSYNTSDLSLRDAFAEYGPVHSVAIVTDRDTGRSKGFGFVEMDDGEGRNAIAALDQSELDGRSIRVSEARPRKNPRGREDGRVNRSDKNNYGW